MIKRNGNVVVVIENGIIVRECFCRDVAEATDVKRGMVRQAIKTYKSFDRNGNPVRVTIPE